ncbi:MAG: RNA chaperone Hfq [Spirochaetia bacterium]|nr:RNA chaperone Hfq [Spirochaetia bacterium]
MTEQHRAYQDQILDFAIQQSKNMSIFLKSGVPIKGRVMAHDAYTILMKTEHNHTLIYKHSISSLFPAIRPR